MAIPHRLSPVGYPLLSISDEELSSLALAGWQPRTQPPLLTAIGFNRPEDAAVLLDAGADPHAIGNRQAAALHAVNIVGT